MSGFKDVLMCTFWYRESFHGLGGFCVCVSESLCSHLCMCAYVSFFLMCVWLYVLIKYVIQRALPRGKGIWDSSNANTLLSHAKDQTDMVKFSFHRQI